jgi:DNA-binding CsgD family transcriptional regulator
MEVRFIKAEIPPAPKFESYLASLISSIGTSQFENSFMTLAREICNCEHITIFLRSDDSPPQVLLAANNGPSQIAHDVARKYVAHYWQLDPAHRVTNEHDAIQLIELQNLEIDDSNYRHDCYMSVGLDRRLSLLRRRPNETIQINAYSKRSGNRSAHGMLEMASNLEVIFALVLKHREQTSSGPASFTNSFRRRLRMTCPTLPEREMEVCVSIAKGLSSEAMAIEWGISVNTVLTYRKRAYTRLNISSQNELMRLVIGHLDGTSHQPSVALC